MNFETEILYELALFAGAGGGLLGGHLNGWRCVGAVECEGYPRGVLAARQNDGCLPAFPIWTDVRSFTKRNNATRRYIRWLRSIRDRLVISGGFPCQDISAAGKGAGIDGERSGLWREFARIIREIRPAVVLVENSPVLTSRGLGVVLGDLAAMGYDARWGVLGAHHAGAPHKRDRIWIVADAARIFSRREDEWTERERTGASGEPAAVADANGFDRGSRAAREDGEEAGRPDPAVPDSLCERSSEIQQSDAGGAGGSGELCPTDACAFDGGGESWWESEPAVGRVADGVAHRVDRLKSIGNGQVGVVVQLAWETLK